MGVIQMVDIKKNNRDLASKNRLALVSRVVARLARFGLTSTRSESSSEGLEKYHHTRYPQPIGERGSQAMDGGSRFSAIIADDHEIVRSALSMALRSPGLIEPNGIAIAAEVGDGLAAIAAAKAHRPSLAILDVQMPLASGVEVVVEIKRWCPDCRVVIFTGVKSPGLIEQLIEGGIDGLFSKSGQIETLHEKIPHILRGGRFIDERFVALLEERPKTPELTGRERQTLNMIVRGNSNKEISLNLGISPKTVEKHRMSLMQKLNVNSVAQLLARAVKDGLIDSSLEL